MTSYKSNKHRLMDRKRVTDYRGGSEPVGAMRLTTLHGIAFFAALLASFAPTGAVFGLNTTPSGDHE
jgi:hypothetical protein